MCPSCNKKRFVRYIDTITDQYLSQNVGRCDREIKCGYHFSPKTYFHKKGHVYLPIINNYNPLIFDDKKWDYHTIEILNETLSNYEINLFNF